MKRYLPFVLLLFAIAVSAQERPGPYKCEIIYHVFQRSFYDSNGDAQGDLNGLRQKLGYLQNLGVTSILMVPLYDADCYHNYFANDFEKIDPAFGSMNDYIELVKDIHRHGMKIYLDMETQYVTAKHLWWKSAVGNLQSPYRDYILFDDSAHQVPATMVFDLRQLNGYDGKVIPVTTVNLRNKGVLAYNIKLFSYFMDPNHDGKFDDGADGFRLDHAMDNLDNKPALTNLFAVFWKPLLNRLKEINPKIKIVAEQAEWSDYGYNYLKNAGVDRMFGFNLRGAILSFNKQQLINKADSTLLLCPEGKQQIVFLENHDLDRLASIEPNVKKQKLAAALMMLIGGVPSIYYGQEIGMKGKSQSFGNTDGNNIPSREAFDWYRSAEGPGMAVWYKNSGPWWDQTNLKANDGISLEEEQHDPGSLFNYYKQLIRLRQSNAALNFGKYVDAGNDNPNVYSFYRVFKGEKVLVAVNLSNQQQHVKLLDSGQKFRIIYGLNPHEGGQHQLTLKPFEFMVLALKPSLKN
jgi:glycosidase